MVFRRAPGRRIRTRLPRLATFALGAATAIAIGVAGCSSPEERIESHAAQARGYTERGLHREAVIEYLSGLRIDPNRGDLHFGLAEAYRALGNEEKAFWELQETVRLDPENHTAKIYYAQTLALSSQDSVREQALEVAREVTALAPELPAAWLAEGRALRALGRLDEAVDAFQRAVAVDPDHGEGLRVLADAHQQLGHKEAAEEHYRRATRADASYFSWISLAQFLARQPGREDETIAAYREAIGSAAELDAIQSTDALAAFLFSRGRFDETERLLVDEYESQDRPGGLLRSLARFYRMRGQPEKAQALITRAADESPGELGPQITLAAYLTDQGDLEGAEAAIARALAIDPSDPDARLRQAHLLTERGRVRGDADALTRGRTLLDALIESKPPNLGSALLVRGRLEIAGGDSATAAKTLQRAIDVGADTEKAHTLLGAALLHTHPRQARAALHRALEARPDSIGARTLLAEIHNRLGEPELAIRVAGASLDQAPQRTDLRRVLAQSLADLARFDEALALLDATPAADVDLSMLLLRAGIERRRGDAAGMRTALLEANSLSPHHASVLEALLELDSREERLEDSAERIAAAASARPDDGAIARLQGRLAIRRGSADEARAHLERALTLSPERLASYYDLAELFAREGDLAQAVATYEDAAAREPNPHLELLLGILYEQSGRLADARDRYERAVDASPSLGPALNNLAFILAERGEDLDRALALAQEAKRVLPDDPGVADTLGWTLYRRGSFAAAVAYLQEAERGFDPDDPIKGVVRHHLALAQEANGEGGRAIATLERALVDLDRIRRQHPDAEPDWANPVRAMLARLRGA